MLSLDTWQQIRHLAAIGWSARAIARELGLSRNTVRGALEDPEPPRYGRARPAASPLDPWRTVIDAGIRRRLSGARLLEEVRAAGYRGSRSTFYHWLAELTAQQRPSVACCRFETGPGEQAQFDWSEYTLALGDAARRVYIFALLLAYSRRVHWFPSLSVRQPAVFEALEAGWRHFGGACRFLVVDNARVFVDRHHGADLVWNANFLRLCGHYRLQPVASTPGHPQGKGKVENPFGRLESRFLVGRQWRDFEHFAAELADFEAVWEQRLHGTTKVAPVERFAAERAQLLPLPGTPFLHLVETFRQVSADCLLSYGGVRYSVPWPYAGKSVLVRESQGQTLAVYAESGKEIARHPLLPSGSPPRILQEHYEGLRRRHYATLAALVPQFKERYGVESEVAGDFLQRLLAQHRHRPRQALAQVMELLSAAPHAVALSALAEAVEFNLCQPRFLEELLRRRLQQNPLAPSQEPVDPRWATQLALPELDVERPLAVYRHALPPMAE